MFEVKLEGMDGLSKQLQELAKAGDPEKVEPILRDGAKDIAAAVKAKAPEGPTGNLKRAVKVKKLKPYGVEPAPYIAAVDRKIAPHAHLVENGHALVRGGRVVGNVPAHPYFRPAVDATLPIVQRDVVDKLSTLVEKAVNRR